MNKTLKKILLFPVNVFFSILYVLLLIAGLILALLSHGLWLLFVKVIGSFFEVLRDCLIILMRASFDIYKEMEKKSKKEKLNG